MKIVSASVLLHDIGRLYPELGSDYHEAGAKKAPEDLRKGGFKDRKISEIIDWIRTLKPRKGKLFYWKPKDIIVFCSFYSLMRLLLGAEECWCDWIKL